MGALQPASCPLLGDSSHGHMPVTGGRWRPRCCPAIRGPAVLGPWGCRELALPCWVLGAPEGTREPRVLALGAGVWPRLCVRPQVGAP